MEHDLVVFVSLIDRVVACVAVDCVEATSEARVAAELDPAAEKAEEFVKGGAVFLVGEELFFSCLAFFHVDDAEFEVLVEGMVVEVANEFEALIF